MFTFRGNPSVMNSEAASQSALSELSTFQDSARFSSQKDGLSLENVFAAMVKDLNDLLEEISACETELVHFSKKGKKGRSKSNQESSFDPSEIEYRDILSMKGNLLEKISTLVERMGSSTEIPKARIHCYQQYAALLKDSYENINAERDQLIKDVNKTKQECEKIKQQVETFKELMEDDDTTDEGRETMQLFNEAKTDLNTLLSVLYPPNVIEVFSSTMAKLTEVFMANDNIEDQYVELSHEIKLNEGIICLMKCHVIVEDPSNPARYRLNMAE